MRRLVTALALSTLLLGCKDDPPHHPFEGTWNLQTIDGHPLPATILWSGSQLRVDDQHFWVLSDGSGLWSSDAQGALDGGSLFDVLIVGTGMRLDATPNTSIGYVPFGIFESQQDGTLKYLEQSHTFIFKKQ